MGAADGKDILVWLDMEMTGLEPKECVPLQVAMVITDSALEELESLELTIWQPESRLERMEPFVRRMHTENGLLAKVRASETSVLDAERKLLALLARHARPQDGVLAGNSIHQDRRFLVEYFPALHGYLHYRMVDVTTLKELVRRWFPDAGFPKAASMHTALADARESIAELKHYKRLVMRAPA